MKNARNPKPESTVRILAQMGGFPNSDDGLFATATIPAWPCNVDLCQPFIRCHGSTTATQHVSNLPPIRLPAGPRTRRQGDARDARDALLSLPRISGSLWQPDRVPAPECLICDASRLTEPLQGACPVVTRRCSGDLTALSRQSTSIADRPGASENLRRSRNQGMNPAGSSQ